MYGIFLDKSNVNISKDLYSWNKEWIFGYRYRVLDRVLIGYLDSIDR